jgi:hypothetical protein
MQWSRSFRTDVCSDARDPGRYAFPLFSWVQGIAALVTSGIVGPDAADELIGDSVTTFMRGSASPR